jgi:site-specific DNA-methyltransferase (adenine-specific)/modification methylase
MEKGGFMLNSIIFGDCIVELKKLQNNSVDLLLTDPPYNASSTVINLPNNTTGGAFYKINEEWDKFDNSADYLNWTRQWLKETDRVLKNMGSSLICCSIHNISEIIFVLKELKYRPLNIITWKKTNPMPNITKRMLTHSVEFVVWFAKDRGWTFNYDDMKKYNNNKQLRDVWEFALCQGNERLKGKNNRASHPTQKPLKLFDRLIEMASNKNDIILDPFIGSGTTAISCLNMSRNYIGIENNVDYYNLANARINEYLEKNGKMCKII